MKTARRFAPTLALLLLTAAPSVAMSHMHGSGMLPKCAKGDPVVVVHTQTKMYTMAKSSDMSSSMRSTMVQHHERLMCRSKARAMGDSMMSKSMMMHSSHSSMMHQSGSTNMPSSMKGAIPTMHAPPAPHPMQSSGEQMQPNSMPLATSSPDASPGPVGPPTTGPANSPAP